MNSCNDITYIKSAVSSKSTKGRNVLLYQYIFVIHLLLLYKVVDPYIRFQIGPNRVSTKLIKDASPAEVLLLI